MTDARGRSSPGITRSFSPSPSLYPPLLLTSSLTDSFLSLSPLIRREKEEDLELRYGLLNKELRALLAIEGNESRIQSVTRVLLLNDKRLKETLTGFHPRVRVT